MKNDEVTKEFRDSIFNGIEYWFSDEILKSTRMKANSKYGQAISNIVYSLGLMETAWKDLPATVITSLEIGIATYGKVCTNLEMSNLIYG